MFLLNYIQDLRVRQSIRRRKDDTFPVILVGLIVQSSDMGTSSVAEADISGTRYVSTSRKEQVVYDTRSRKGVIFRLRKWKEFVWV